jgi:hypothetical protein
MASTRVLTNAVADLLNKSIPQLQYEIGQTKKSIRNNEQKICQIQELIKDMGNNGNTNGNANENASCNYKDFSKMNTCDTLIQTYDDNTGKYTRIYKEMTLEDFNELKSTFGFNEAEKIDYAGTACILNLRDYKSYNRELLKEVANFRMGEAACTSLRFTPPFLFDLYLDRTSPKINSFKLDRDIYSDITELIFEYGHANHVYNCANINIFSRDNGIQYFNHIRNITINGNVNSLTLNISDGESYSQPYITSIDEYLDQEPVNMNTISFPVVRENLGIDIRVPIAIDFLDISKSNRIHQADVRMLILTKPTVIKMSKIAEHDSFNVFYKEGNKPRLISDELTSEELAAYEAKMRAVTLTY